jgi:cytochrome c-type biogenesis protein CcmH/NrfG
MKALWTAVLLTAALVVYLVLLTDRAVLLIQSGSAVGLGLGIAVLALPVIGVWFVVAQWRNGIRVARLARRLAAEGGLPDTSDLPRRPSGRVDRDAADQWFAQRRVEVEQAPEDWRAWFRLAHAYDVAGDRGRAREAMRKAIELGG